MKPHYKFSLSFGILLILSIAPLSRATAQEPAHEVRKIIDKLFDSMRSGDSTTLRSIFTSQCSLTSISRNAADSVIIHKSGIDGFAKAVGTPHAEKWDEKIYEVNIRIDEPMAIVWAPYKFYLGDKFSHCGVNVLTLIHTKSGWKISEITDTRRKEKCL